jgi:hypothetical protein
MRLPLGAVSFMIAALALAACGGGGSASGPAPMSGAPAVTNQTAVTTEAQAVQLENEAQQGDNDDDRNDDNAAVLPQLTRQTTIGTTVDPVNGDQEPYGLDISKVDTGLLDRGDLIVCNFKNSDALGAHEGEGTTIVTLHPQPGSSPKRFKQDASLKGCAALAFAPNGNIWAAAFSANDNPIFTPDGAVVNTLAGGPWDGPFGEAFAPAGPSRNAAFYVSNVGKSTSSTAGSIVRVNIPSLSEDVIATGFAINGGAIHVPGNLLGPSGLQYDAKRDRLFIVDGADNSLTVFNFVSQIPAGGITVGKNGQFSGVARRLAKRLFSGSPLHGPISSAVLPNGHLVLGNTGLDTPSPPLHPNTMVEFSRSGRRVLATKDVDTGPTPAPAAAIFGMVATGTSKDDTKIFFGDDNRNTIQLVSD